jgi:hypothetical protein
MKVKLVIEDFQTIKKIEHFKEVKNLRLTSMKIFHRNMAGS